MEGFTRQPIRSWLLAAYSDPDAPIHCESIGCTVLLNEVYQ